MPGVLSSARERFFQIHRRFSGGSRISLFEMVSLPKACKLCGRFFVVAECRARMYSRWRKA